MKKASLKKDLRKARVVFAILFLAMGLVGMIHYSIQSSARSEKVSIGDTSFEELQKYTAHDFPEQMLKTERSKVLGSMEASF